MRVQFDSTLEHAWVALSSVSVMAEAAEEELPAWLRVGRAVEARDPVGEAGGKGKQVVWHPATVEEARSGAEEGRGGRLRLWVRYAASGLCQWVRREQVREVGAVGGGGEADGDALAEAAAEVAPTTSPRAGQKPRGGQGTKRHSGGNDQSASKLLRVAQLSTLQSLCADWGLDTAGSRKNLVSRLLAVTVREE